MLLYAFQNGLNPENEQRPTTKQHQFPILIKKIRDNATWPTTSYDDAAGLDLHSTEDVTIMPNERGTFDTGLRFKLPPKTYGRIADKSGVALRKGLIVLGGVLDPDYVGETKVILTNIGKGTVNIREGEAIAQMICERYAQPRMQRVDAIEQQMTLRGSRCFGTGI